MSLKTKAYRIVIRKDTFDSFLDGVCSVLDLFPGGYDVLPSWETDARAMHGDMSKVSEDLWHVLKQYDDQKAA